MLLDFRSQELVFEKFSYSYKDASGRNGHIVITERQIIYPNKNKFKNLNFNHFEKIGVLL
jgi:hypothetical protein